MRGLIDCDNFFVSCERSVRPELRGKPVVVLSNNDGCVIARSNEAKAMGIRMGVPVFEIRDIIRSGVVTALSGNHSLYSDISRRTHEIVRGYVPGSLDYSVDESFLNVDGIPEEILPEIGERMRRHIAEEVGIPVTIGFSFSKALAKLAVESIKKTSVHVRVLTENTEIESLLSDLPVNGLWGIGRRLVKRLYSEGVYSAGDFYNRPSGWIREKLGVTGERLWLELHGVDCIELGFKETPLQDSISETRTFAKDTSNYDWIESRITGYVGSCARRLRNMRGECRCVSVFLRTNRFKDSGEIYNPSAEILLGVPVSDSVLLTAAAMKCLRKIYKDGVRYKRGGVILSKITPAAVWTPSLFEERADNDKSLEKRRSLMSAVDVLNCRTQGGIRLASEFGL